MVKNKISYGFGVGVGVGVGLLTMQVEYKLLPLKLTIGGLEDPEVNTHDLTSDTQDPPEGTEFVLKYDLLLPTEI